MLGSIAKHRLFTPPSLQSSGQCWCACVDQKHIETLLHQLELCTVIREEVESQLLAWRFCCCMMLYVRHESCCGSFISYFIDMRYMRCRPGERRLLLRMIPTNDLNKFGGHCGRHEGVMRKANGCYLRFQTPRKCNQIISNTVLAISIPFWNVWRDASEVRIRSGHPMQGT